jgi:glycerol-3-phosphate O-acyltransferase
VSLRRYVRERELDFRTLPESARNERIAGLAAELMAEVGRAVPALPVSLVAAALLAAEGRSSSTLDLKVAVAQSMIRIREAGGQVYVPRADEEYAVDVGLRMLALRHIVAEIDGIVTIVPGQDALLGYYANALDHVLAPNRGR